MFNRSISFIMGLLISCVAHAYTDQIAIEIPNSAKSVFDVRIHSYLRHLYEQKIEIDPLTSEWLASTYEDELQDFVEQYLVYEYVLENKMDYLPEKSDRDKAAKAMDQWFKDNQSKKNTTFEKLSLSREDVLQWVEARVTLGRFLNDYILNRVVITDQRLSEHYEAYRSTRFLDRPFVQIKDKVQADLQDRLLELEFEKWISQEKRRKKLIIKSLDTTS